MRLLAIPLLLLATAAAAHQGVQNADVKARMDLMSQIGAANKVLGQMAKGRTPFDASAANAAREALGLHATLTPASFENGADDPKSEARRTIWDDWDRFVELSDDMVAATTTPIQSEDDLRRTLRDLGQTCQACHELFRD